MNNPFKGLQRNYHLWNRGQDKIRTAYARGLDRLKAKRAAARRRKARKPR